MIPVGNVLKRVVEAEGIFPVVEVAIDLDGLIWKWFGKWGGAFEAPDVGDHLVVVGVLIATFHGLDIAREFFAEAVDKIRFPLFEFSASHVVSSFAWGKEKSLGDPLVPTGDEDDLGINLEGVIPLFLEVESV